MSTNIPFLQAVLEDPDFIAGDVSTAFIEQRPELLTTHAPPTGAPGCCAGWPRSRSTSRTATPPTLLDPGASARPASIFQAVAGGVAAAAAGARPGGLRRRPAVAVGVEVTDTTFRDAHQSLLATRVRTKDLLRIAPYVGPDDPAAVVGRVLGRGDVRRRAAVPAEDPWERLAALRYNMPGLCLQMLLRGRNTVGYTPYPTKVTTSFVAEAADVGIDIFRIFDALNDVEQMRPAIEAVVRPARRSPRSRCATPRDLNDPDEDLYTLDYYLRLAEQIVDAGAHMLAIKDMAGLLRPPAARQAGLGPAGAVRPAGAPAHPRHRRRSAGHAARRRRCRGGRGGRGVGADGRHHQPAAGLGPGGGAGAHRAGDAPGPAGGDGPRAVLGGGAQGLRAVRVGAAEPDRPGLRPRDPRWAAVQPAPAGDRAGAGGQVRADRGDVRGRVRASWVGRPR